MNAADTALAAELRKLRGDLKYAHKECQRTGAPMTHDERYADHRIKVSPATLARLILAIEMVDELHRRASVVVGGQGMGREGLGYPSAGGDDW